MDKKKTISTYNWRPFITAALLILIILLIFFPDKETHVPSNEKTDKIAINAELLPVHIDTLKNLIDTFFIKRNAHYKFNIVNGLLVLKSDRFSSDNIEFYNNPELLKITNQGFLIRNLPGNNGLEATFQITRKDGDEYVLIPTDILFRLIKSRQTARNN